MCCTLHSKLAMGRNGSCLQVIILIFCLTIQPLMKLFHNSLKLNKSITTDQINMLYSIFTSLGPVGRTCLQTISMRNEGDYLRSLSYYIGEIDREIEGMIYAGVLQKVDISVHPHASHRILIMDPSNDRQSYKSHITSRWIAHRVFDQAQKQSKKRCYQLYQKLTGKGERGRVASWFFES